MWNCGYGVSTPRIWPRSGPRQTPQTLGNYELDVEERRDCASNPIVKAQVQIEPSGSGEMVSTAFQVLDGRRIVVRLSGGVPGRNYTVLLTWAHLNGDDDSEAIGVPMDTTDMTYPIRPALSPTYGLSMFWPYVYNGLVANGTTIGVVSSFQTGWPTSSTDLPPGAAWLNSGVVNIVAGQTPDLTIPMFYGPNTSAQILEYGGLYLPTFDPLVTGQLWNNNGVVNQSSGPTNGLSSNGGALIVVDATGWPTSPEDLLPGSVWSNGGEIAIVPGGIAQLTPVFFSMITAPELLAFGGAFLPTSDPKIAGQLWSNGGVVCASAG